jgi:predicted amidohydrolase YtcJ
VPIVPDAVHHNARIYTLEPDQPWASVLLLRDGLVVAVGDEELLDQVGGTPEVVDHDGAFLMPGLGDVHNHHLLAGRADLRRSGSP